MSTSTSPKSASDSPQSTSRRDRNGRLEKLRRSRCLKRAGRWEPVGEGHIRYLWRAYKRGELKDFPLAEGLEPTEFRTKIGELFAALSGDILIFVNLDEIPIGMVGVTYGQTGERTRAFPHAVWFQEGTARQRLEVSLRFLLNLKKTHLVVIECQEAAWRFFEHLCKYGVLRRVGTIRDAYGEGKRSALYQSVGK